MPPGGAPSPAIEDKRPQAAHPGKGRGHSPSPAPRGGPRIAFEAGDPGVVARLAARGLGVAILPVSAAQGRPGQLHAISVTHPRLRARIVLAWRDDGPVSPAARALISHARAVLGCHG
ncbi:MAG: hypothetical protein QOI83_1257 [Streptomycetaceae bacterium]|nr:hypothetical protein [Streptomycetaceae bacterium]